MHTESLDLNLLRVLDAVLREKNVTRAAAELRMSQPATSHALARLRRALDDPLLVREGNRLVVTREGERLRLIVAQIMHLVRDEITTPGFDPESSTLTVSLAMPNFLYYRIFPGLAANIRRAAPGIRLEIVSFQHDAHERFARGDLDVLVTFARHVPRGPAEPLCRLPVRGLAAAGNPAVENLTVAGYAGLPHLSIPGNPLEHQIDRRLAEHGLRRNVVATIPHQELAAPMIRGTDLVFMSHWEEPASSGLATFAHPFELPPDELSIVRPEARRNHLPGQWLADQVRAAATAAGLRAGS